MLKPGYPGNEQWPGRHRGEAFVKLRLAEALQGRKIILLPVSDGGMNLKTTDINQLIHTMGVKSLPKGKAALK
ncbi:hypothetical protein D3OALGA1CA_5803 [Olavius algarvensis associated proteobacterium Delta 3]|nr:hypothetical protein D3OALGB2SA_1230 [Olavius algarvensis associated proteobacterium Delta 3]CAB5172053.1 hypothetical protein D3OALGA1CA_5803 [Olavius algarvensis associated proteobacterium Delta 3]